jgi:hypothetical protein
MEDHTKHEDAPAKPYDQEQDTDPIEPIARIDEARARRKVVFESFPPPEEQDNF